ncbi:MAG: hypothetical protein ABFC38_00375 [Methanospirillum sp.]
MGKKVWILLILCAVILGSIMASGCTTTSPTPSQLSTAAPSQKTTLPTTFVSRTSTPTAIPSPTAEAPTALTVEQAQFAVQKALNVVASESSMAVKDDKGQPLFTYTIADGVILPKGAIAGTPTLIDRSGQSIYKVPILSGGSVAGYVYVNPEMKLTGSSRVYQTEEIEFINSGSIKKLIVTHSSDMLSYKVEFI